MKNLNEKEVDLEACFAAVTRRLKGESVGTESASCTRALYSAWEKAKTADTGQATKTAGDWWNRAVDRFTEWSTVRARGANQVGTRLSLLWPLALSLSAIVLLVIASGMATRGYFLGACIDERNRLSLSRLQQLLWSIVLFGGVAILGVFNVALIADFVRNAGQAAEFQGEASSLLGFFPSMDMALWSVLGITVVASPLLSKDILSKKASGAEDVSVLQADENKPIVRPEPMDYRNTPEKARWTDLFTGEATANRNTVDVSRLQHMVITVLLLSSYLVMLVEYSRSIDALAVIVALLTGEPVFAEMPPVDQTFVGLLVVSHGSYLVYKTRSSAVAAPSAGDPQT